MRGWWSVGSPEGHQWRGRHLLSNSDVIAIFRPKKKGCNGKLLSAAANKLQYQEYLSFLSLQKWLQAARPLQIALVFL